MFQGFFKDQPQTLKFLGAQKVPRGCRARCVTTRAASCGPAPFCAMTSLGSKLKKKDKT